MVFKSSAMDLWIQIWSLTLLRRDIPNFHWVILITGSLYWMRLWCIPSSIVWVILELKLLSARHRRNIATRATYIPNWTWSLGPARMQRKDDLPASATKPSTPRSITTLSSGYILVELISSGHQVFWEHTPINFCKHCIVHRMQRRSRLWPADRWDNSTALRTCRTFSCNGYRGHQVPIGFIEVSIPNLKQSLRCETLSMSTLDLRHVQVVQQTFGKGNWSFEIPTGEVAIGLATAT